MKVFLREIPMKPFLLNYVGSTNFEIHMKPFLLNYVGPTNLKFFWPLMVLISRKVFLDYVGSTNFWPLLVFPAPADSTLSLLLGFEAPWGY
jgi:hypothetical protein